MALAPRQDVTDHPGALCRRARSRDRTVSARNARPADRAVAAAVEVAHRATVHWPGESAARDCYTPLARMARRRQRRGSPGGTPRSTTQKAEREPSARACACGFGYVARAG